MRGIEDQPGFASVPQKARQGERKSDRASGVCAGWISDGGRGQRRVKSAPMNKWPFRCVVLGLGLVWATAGVGETVRPVVNRDYLPAVLDLINGATNSIEFLQLERHDDRAEQAIETALAAAVKR